MKEDSPATPSRRKRRASGHHCSVHGCRYKVVSRDGAELPLCGGHSQKFRRDMVNFDGGFGNSCTWPGCREYTIWPDGSPLCPRHTERIIELASEDERFVRKTDRFKSLVDEVAEPVIAARKARIAKAAQQASEGTVYFLRSGGYYKIGWASDLAKRMRSYPPDTQLLATLSGTRKDEAQLHKRFAHHKSHGREWFSMGADLTAYIDSVVREHGIPEQVQFMARPVGVPMPHRINKTTGPKVKGSPMRATSA